MQKERRDKWKFSCLCASREDQELLTAGGLSRLIKIKIITSVTIHCHARQDHIIVQGRTLKLDKLV